MAEKRGVGMERFGRIQPQLAWQQLRADPVLGPVVLKWGECPILPHDDYFTELCESILSQQISGKVAKAIATRFKSLLNDQVTPASLLSVSMEELRQIGISLRKGESLQDLARYCVNGEILLTELAGWSDDEITRQLVRVKGIGPWTVMMFLLFSLGRPRVIPSTDYGIRKAVQTLFDLAEMPQPQDVVEYYARWAPHESAASWYLWRSLENDGRV